MTEKEQKILVNTIYFLHLQNNTEHNDPDKAFKAGIECAIEELLNSKDYENNINITD